MAESRSFCILLSVNQKYTELLKKVLIIVVISLLIILGYGIYNVYNIFYANYFDQLTYRQDVWPGRTTAPSKTEILLWGFTDIKTISLSLLTAIALFTIFKIIKRK